MQSDAELVGRVLDGDAVAYDELVRRYEATVRGVCVGVLGDLHGAEDAAQESFVQAYMKLGQLRQAKMFGGWLVRIAKRQALRLAKQRARQRVRSVPEDLAAPERDGRLDERLRALLGKVTQLPPSERQVIVLRYFNDHSVGELAEITGRSVGTVTKQLSQARKRLQKQLSREDS